MYVQRGRDPLIYFKVSRGLFQRVEPVFGEIGLNVAFTESSMSSIGNVETADCL